MQINLPLPDEGRVPSFSQTLAAIHGIPEIMWGAMEFGTSQNRAYFEKLSGNEKPRLHIREMIVRDQAKRYLERLNFQVDDEEINVSNDPLVSLGARFGPVQFRILKGRNGILPGCGDSLLRRRFYAQYPKPYTDASRQVRQSKLNLIVLWDFDSSFNLAGLWLVCPQSGGQRADDVRWFWSNPLQHPALNIQDQPSPSPVSEEELDGKLERLLRGQAQTDEDADEEDDKKSGS